MYKINVGYKVNERFSKTGVRWEYHGKVAEWEKSVEDWRRGIKSGCIRGVRVTDLETGEIVYCEEYKEDKNV